MTFWTARLAGSNSARHVAIRAIPASRALTPHPRRERAAVLLVERDHVPCRLHARGRLRDERLRDHPHLAEHRRRPGQHEGVGTVGPPPPAAPRSGRPAHPCGSSSCRAPLCRLATRAVLGRGPARGAWPGRSSRLKPPPVRAAHQPPRGKGRLDRRPPRKVARCHPELIIAAPELTIRGRARPRRHGQAPGRRSCASAGCATPARGHGAPTPRSRTVPPCRLSPASPRCTRISDPRTCPRP